MRFLNKHLDGIDSISFYCAQILMNFAEKLS